MKVKHDDTDIKLEAKVKLADVNNAVSPTVLPEVFPSIKTALALVN